MDKKKVAVPLVCHGHSRPVVDLFYSPVTPDGFFLISASKGMPALSPPRFLWLSVVLSGEFYPFSFGHLLLTVILNSIKQLDFLCIVI